VYAKELMKQWTNVHNTDTIPDSIVSSFNGNNLIQLKKYNDASGKTVVQTYMIGTMQHGISVDPGTCFQQGGMAGSYSYDENFYSSFWAAEFFGIIKFPYSITGPISVLFNQQNIVFSIPSHSGSTYNWAVPKGAVIVSGQGTNLVTVNWGVNSGFIVVNETNSSSCKIGPTELYVEATLNTGINGNINNSPEMLVFPSQTGEALIIKSSLKSYDVFLFDITGKLILCVKNQSGEKTIRLPSNMPAGVYTTHIISGDKVFNRKFIKAF
jgi:hypothetical protein